MTAIGVVLVGGKENGPAVGGERGIVPDGAYLRFHAFVNFLYLGLLVVGQIQIGKFVLMFLAVLGDGLLAGIRLRCLLILPRCYHCRDAAQCEQCRSERHVF